MKRKYRINKFKFTIFISMLTLVFGLYAINSVRTNHLEDLLQGSYELICVESGDSLWTIAKNAGKPGDDVRKTIYDICELNQISGDMIHPGDELLIPVYL